jgi:hypothetical protein
MAFATAQDMLDRIDNRWLFKLVLDTGIIATEAQFLASPRTAACLSDGAGIIVAHTLQGGRYVTADLLALTGDSLGLLIRMNVDLAAALYGESRQVPLKDIEQTVPGYGRAMALLQQLQLGNVVFDVQTAIDAGSPKLARNKAGYLVDNMGRYFGDVWETEAQANRQLPAPEPRFEGNP